MNVFRICRSPQKAAALDFREGESKRATLSAGVKDIMGVFQSFHGRVPDSHGRLLILVKDTIANDHDS